ncbi:MAG: acetoin utilization protein AcuC [Alphaproteobacteria bacterium]|nr:acetoin utilization protein AcuC [Alphaproteobacteria bacterium SS10]
MSDTNTLARPQVKSASALGRPILIGHEIYRNSRYGTKHPLSIPRVSTALDLINAMGWVGQDQYVEGRPATEAQLAWFHEPDYIAALKRTQQSQKADAETRERYNLGRMENPIFAEMFDRPAMASGSSIMAAELLRDGGVVYNVAGGTHHGKPGRASGFCYLNDPVLGLMAMLRMGLTRIAYVDIDAHHGDGVQDAFHDDDRVFTISIHEGGRWPQTGQLDDRAGGMARNLPVPKGLNNAEMLHLIDQAVVPLVQAFEPEAIVIQGGCDSLAEDPLSGLSLSNRGYWGAIDCLRGLAPRLLMLGGGGYNPWTVGRAWSGVWRLLNDLPMPDRLPAPAESILRSIHWRHRLADNPPERWFTTLADPVDEQEQTIRDEIKYVADAVLA